MISVTCNIDTKIGKNLTVSDYGPGGGYVQISTGPDNYSVVLAEDLIAAIRNSLNIGSNGD